MNRKITLALILGCITIAQMNVFAQDNGEVKTLIGGDNPVNFKNLGFLIEPSYGLTQMDGSSASLFNLRSGITFNNSFSMGAYFNTSLNEIRPQSEIDPSIYMDYWTIGGFMEYTLHANKLIHLAFPLYLGYGEVQMDDENDDLYLGEANFFQIEPVGLIEINLTKYVRFNLGVGYRIVGQMDYRNFNESDISGLTGRVGLKFGLFK